MIKLFLGFCRLGRNPASAVPRSQILYGDRHMVQDELAAKEKQYAEALQQVRGSRCQSIAHVFHTAHIQQLCRNNHTGVQCHNSAPQYIGKSFMF